jgi:hypothetical protein
LSGCTTGGFSRGVQLYEIMYSVSNCVPSEINGDNLNNIRHKASRHFRNKKREYPKDKMSLQPAVTTRTFETCIEE